MSMKSVHEWNYWLSVSTCWPVEKWQNAATKTRFLRDVIDHSDQCEQGKDHFSMETGQVQWQAGYIYRWMDSYRRLQSCPKAVTHDAPLLPRASWAGLCLQDVPDCCPKGSFSNISTNVWEDYAHLFQPLASFGKINLGCWIKDGLPSEASARGPNPDLTWPFL